MDLEALAWRYGASTDTNHSMSSASGSLRWHCEQICAYVSLQRGLVKTMMSMSQSGHRTFGLSTWSQEIRNLFRMQTQLYENVFCEFSNRLVRMVCSGTFSTTTTNFNNYWCTWKRRYTNLVVLTTNDESRDLKKLEVLFRGFVGFSEEKSF